MEITDDYLVFYHGGDHIIQKIEDTNPLYGGLEFGGIFACEAGDAGVLDHDFSHYGPHLHRILVKREDICTGFYGLNFEKAREFIHRGLKDHDLSDDYYAAAWNAICDEDFSAEDDEIEALVKSGWICNGCADDDLHTCFGWGAQAVRLKLAQACGYTAVEVHDENGISCLIGTGQKIEYLYSIEPIHHLKTVF